MKQESLAEVGNTPLVRLEGVYAKLECVNPTGSIKDRMVKFIVDESERRGLLKKGMNLVEATSGNTGIALSWYARQKGYGVTIIMPDNMTDERKRLIKSFGARLVLSSAKGSFPEAVRLRDEMARDGRYFSTNQFSNQLNVECHYRTTGQEIIRQLRAERRVAEAFVAGVGTGGTLIGVAKALREVNPTVRVVAVEPEESAVMSGGTPGPHAIQGIGDGFIPEIVHSEKGNLNSMIDGVVRVKSDDAVEASKSIEKSHGYCVGVSSGANFLVAKSLLGKHGTVVTIFPDGFNRYVSLGLSSSGRCTFTNRACEAARAAAGVD